MNAPVTCCAIAALAAMIATDCNADIIELGSFRNTGGGSIGYSGGYTEYVSSSLDPTGLHTLIEIDLTSLLLESAYAGFLAVIISDSGGNQYGQSSPGADVDYFAFDFNAWELLPTFSYDGPNAIHQAESPQRLADRVGAMDSLSGHQDHSHRTHVSLGEAGALTAAFDGPVFVEGIDAKLLVSESGFGESFFISIQTVVPAPPAAALFFISLGAGTRRRRRAA